MSAKPVLMTARKPKSSSAQGACSRDEPQPKLWPATRTDAPRASLLRCREFAREDRDENDVVDAEHDLEHRQREQAQPRFRTQ